MGKPRKPRGKKVGVMNLYSYDWDGETLAVIYGRKNLTGVACTVKHARQVATWLTRWADWRDAQTTNHKEERKIT